MSFVVFSGVPGSGKSTVARKLAPRLSLPVLDKDDFLDELFKERGAGDAAWRSALSREADARLVRTAWELPGACLVSWWRNYKVSETTGTPVEWLSNLRAPLVEVHCRCRVETAVDRFLARERHPGHLDTSRTRTSLITQFNAFDAAGPIACGPLLVLDTEQDVNPDVVVDQLQNLKRVLPNLEDR
jgi:adenylylsulfate kinase-like enzyme